MVFIIWSNQGGPLQYAGLLLFLLQFASPLISQWQLQPVHLWALFGGLLGGIAASLWYTGQWQRMLSRARQLVVQMTGLSEDSIWVWPIAIAVDVAALLVVRWVWMQSPSTVITLAQFAMAGYMAQAHLGHNGHPQEPRINEEQRMAELAELVRTLPMEEFVPQEDMEFKSATLANIDDKEGNACHESHSTNDNPNTHHHHLSIARLKRMLERRGKATHDFVERSELVDALQQCRNYADTCCICCEDYQRGDPIRVLPKCRHEFHVECLDQWAYTFAQRKYQNQPQGGGGKRRMPTCPLCNTSLR